MTRLSLGVAMPDLMWLRDREHHYPFVRPVYERRPQVGALVARDGRAWRVLEVNDLIPGDWNDDDEQMWRTWHEPDPETWTRRPFEVIVVPHELKTDQKWRMVVRARHAVSWNVLPEHYAVCVTCGTLAPCDGLMHEAETQRAVAAADRAMQVMDGACPACNEPFTARQLATAYTFVGENLLNPLARPWVAFHNRRRCRADAAAYEEKWVAADPDNRERSLLTLRCSGRVVVHADGTGECTGRNDGSDCPHIYARHGRVTACCVMSRGCPRVECQGSRHGTRLAKGLTPNGDHPTMEGA